MSRDIAGSNTYRGLFLAVAGPLLARYGIDIQDPQLLVAIEAVLTIGGVLWSMWGRQHASGPVTHVLSLPLPQALIPAPKIEEPKS